MNKFITNLVDWLKKTITQVVNYDYMVTYDFSDLKDLEQQIVADALSGKIRFSVSKIPTTVSVDHHIKATNRHISIRIDHAFIGGTFTFITIQDMDLSYELVSKFDYQRVITAILKREDVPTTETSLYWL
jgi:hypothetical protein